MPELPEVETVKETLKKKVKNKRIIDVKVLWPNIIAGISVDEFIKNTKGQTIQDIRRKGKWLLFFLDDYVLLSHLRMEGKYFFKSYNEKLEKHEHVIFVFEDETELRYYDTRKFGKMHLSPKQNYETYPALAKLGLEPWNTGLTTDYLKNKFKTKKLPIKTVILDQSIIAGIGNIYADEILFLSKIHPLKKANNLKNKELLNIIENSKIVLEKAIEEGGTTIRSYTSEEGIHGRFQHELYVHTRENEACKICNHKIEKIVVGGRSSYFCPNCQNLK